MSPTFVDIDGHIMEPADLWENYIDPEYKHRAIRIETDAQGLEYLSVDGKPAWFLRGGTLGALGAIGQDVRPYLTPGKIKWRDAMLPGAYIPDERVKVMDSERIDMTLVYPSLGLGWENDCEDPHLAGVYCRAYNNWVFDFCKPFPHRLIPVAHVPSMDVEEGIKELQRTAKLGAKAVMMGSDPASGYPYGHQFYDRLWAEAQDLDIPVTIHPATGKDSITARAYPSRDMIRAWWVFVLGGENVKMNFTSFFAEGTFERFPRLKVVVLESGIGWLVYWLDRMDEKFEVNGLTTPMKMKPSDYFHRNCWISMDPDERLAKFSIEVLGANKFMWAYDYPHSDSILNPVEELDENLAPLPEGDRLKIYGQNAIKLYNLVA